MDDVAYTVVVDLDRAAGLFPEVIRFAHGDRVLVVVEYEAWKSRVKARQERGEQ